MNYYVAGLFKSVSNYVSNSPKVAYFPRIRHEYDIKSEEFPQLR